jgi:hypothetical protein
MIFTDGLKDWPVSFWAYQFKDDAKAAEKRIIKKYSNCHATVKRSKIEKM